MFKPSDITLYVPFYNAWTTMRQCLGGIAKQTVRPGSVIIVDDGSAEPFSDKDSLDPELRIIKHETNKGLSAARNTALEAASTPLLASLDSDVAPEPEWLEKLLFAINDRPVEGVGGKLVEFFSENVGDRWRAVHMCQHWGGEQILNPRFIYGANNLFKTDILRECGGYIKDLRTNYEDMSLSENIYSRGMNLFYEPAAVCFHLRRDDEVSILPGFWKWFHAKAVLRGDFRNPAGLLGRIDSVGFGIYRYRFDRDIAGERHELLMLDSLIPWVFSALDLQFAARTYGVSVPDFPGDKLLAELPGKHRALFTKIVKQCPVPTTHEHWHDEYIMKFKKCLTDFHWHDDLNLIPLRHV